jgi:hypothetical protein
MPMRYGFDARRLWPIMTVMSKPKDGLPEATGTETAGRNDVDAFIRQVESLPQLRPSGRGRLIVALDATASRQPSWDHACQIQGEMFEAAATVGGLEIQLVFYRGFGECKASRWYAAAADLHRVMSSVACAGGQTQIERVLDHALAETRRSRVNALVFVGDAMEENPDALCHRAGELGMLGVPLFLFHEGRDETAGRTFREMARLSRGAYCRFDAASARQLRDLLTAVAVYVAGGRAALEDYGRRQGGAVLLLTRELGGG